MIAAKTGSDTPQNSTNLLGGVAIADCPPEVIFNACLTLSVKEDSKRLGEMLSELSRRASRYLRGRLNRNLPNEGQDVLKATVDLMLDAAMGLRPADAEGFGSAFHVCLSRRLTDEIRRARVRGWREPEHERNEEGEEAPMPDLSQATPEQALAIKTLLADAPPNKRRALALVRCGYPVSSTDPAKRTVCSELKVSARTAEAWVREMKALVRERMKS